MCVFRPLKRTSNGIVFTFLEWFPIYCHFDSARIIPIGFPYNMQCHLVMAPTHWMAMWSPCLPIQSVWGRSCILDCTKHLYCNTSLFCNVDTESLNTAYHIVVNSDNALYLYLDSREHNPLFKASCLAFISTLLIITMFQCRHFTALGMNHQVTPRLYTGPAKMG